MDGDIYASEQSRLRRLRRRLWLERAVFLLLLLLLLAHHRGAWKGRRQAWLIAVDGRPVVVVASAREAKRLLQEVKRASVPAELSQQVDLDEVRFAQRVTLHRVPAEAHEVAGAAEAMGALASRLQPVVEAAAILANGEVVVALPETAEATRTLSLILQEFTPKGEGFTSVFKEEVRVERRLVPLDRYVRTAREAVAKIRQAEEPARTHEVKPGETAWKIALAEGVPLDRLQRANPGLDLNRLRAGAQVKIPGKGAPITVISQKEILEPGGEGPRRRLQVVRLTYENGVQVSREVIGYRPLPSQGQERGRRAEPAREEER